MIFSETKLKRIFIIKPGNQDITYPDTFDPEKTLNSAFDLIHGDPITVKILFTPNEARYITKKTWSRTQHLTPMAPSPSP